MLCLRSATSHFAIFSITLLALALPAFAGPKVIKASHHDTSSALTVLAAGGNMRNPGPDREAEEPRATGPARLSSKSDTVAGQLTSPLNGVTPILSFDGQTADDNRAVFGF